MVMVMESTVLQVGPKSSIGGKLGGDCILFTSFSYSPNHSGAWKQLRLICFSTLLFRFFPSVCPPSVCGHIKQEFARGRKEKSYTIKNSAWMEASYKLDYGEFEKENMMLPS